MSDQEVDEGGKGDEGTGDKKKEQVFGVKVICLGDSAVGKSKLLDRFLSDKYKPKEVSTFALTLYRYATRVNEEDVDVELWDTAGQERFHSLHPSYYHAADACIMVFDATRKVTYRNLIQWYEELRQYRPEIPCFVAANKIDSNMEITKRSFKFTESNDIPIYFVSAATGSNVVKLFKEAIDAAVKYKKNPTHWTDQVLIELEKTIEEAESKKETEEKTEENENPSSKS